MLQKGFGAMFKIKCVCTCGGEETTCVTPLCHAQHSAVYHFQVSYKTKVDRKFSGLCSVCSGLKYYKYLRALIPVIPLPRLASLLLAIE